MEPPAGSYEIRCCENPSCGFRYPAPANHPRKNWCPACRGETHLVRTLAPAEQPNSHPVSKPVRIVAALLDNLRSTLNVGSIFRTADGAGVARLALCGITPTPENPKLAKTSLGAELRVPWDYHRSAIAAADALRSQGCLLIALETGERSQPLYETALDRFNGRPLALFAGNEITGIDPDLLARCDIQLALPMRGSKASLNVAVAFGAAAYYLTSAPVVDEPSADG